MHAVDLAGWLAATLTLMTFVCRDMRRLRMLGLAANVAFIAYGAAAGLLPVLALHTMLAPVNLWRLRELLQPVAGAALPLPVPAAATVDGCPRCIRPRHWRKPPPPQRGSRRPVAAAGRRPSRRDRGSRTTRT